MIRTALITGASTGIGATCVEWLVARGWHVYAGVRSSAAAARLASRFGAAVSVLRFDVTDDEAVREAAARVVAEVGERGLHGVVANAGIALAAPLEFLPVAELRHQLDVNVVGQVAVVQAVLPALRRARGRIVLVGSIAGRSAMPFMGPYSASKHALEAIADSWRLELAPFGVHVALIEPGVISTPIWATGVKHAEAMIARMPGAVHEYYGPAIERLKARALRGVEGLPPERVAAAIEAALTEARPRARYLVGRDARTRVWLQRLPTRLRDRLILRALRRL